MDRQKESAIAAAFFEDIGSRGGETEAKPVIQKPVRTPPESKERPAAQNTKRAPSIKKTAPALKASRVSSPPTSPQKPPEGFKVNPIYVEKRSRKVVLMLQPSLYDKVKKQADKENRSVNDWAISILEQAFADS
jgi:hypothetical protein